MTGARCAPVPLAAIALVAMAGRVGWLPWNTLPWPAIARAALVLLEGFCIVSAVLGFIAVAVGLPVVLMALLAAALVRTCAARRRGVAP